MYDYQLKYLIYTLYRNNTKLRQLSKDGVLSSKDLWDLQDEAVEWAKKDGLLKSTTD